MVLILYGNLMSHAQIGFITMRTPSISYGLYRQILLFCFYWVPIVYSLWLSRDNTVSFEWKHTANKQTCTISTENTTGIFRATSQCNHEWESKDTTVPQKKKTTHAHSADGC